MSTDTAANLETARRKNGQFGNQHRDEPEAGALATATLDATFCYECGEPVVTEENGVSHHLNDDGEIDYDADADHVALDEREMNPVAPAQPASVFLRDPVATEDAWLAACLEYRRVEDGSDYEARDAASLALTQAGTRYASTSREAAQRVADEQPGSSAVYSANTGLREAAYGKYWAEQGVGNNPVPVSIADVRRELQPGRQLLVRFLAGGDGQPILREVVSQSAHQMKTKGYDTGDSYNDWGKKKAWSDDAGNLIIADQFERPYVAYQPL